jgi:hypothetical protein
LCEASQRSAQNLYLLVWKDERHDGKITEAVRLARYEGDDNYVEIKRTDGDYTVLPIVWRMLPLNGGRALSLLCSYCNTPRRHVHGWEWDSISGWSNRVRTNISTAQTNTGTIPIRA